MNISYYSSDFVENLSIPRLVGTEGETKAQKIIEAELKRLNIENYEKQSFYCCNYRNNMLRFYDVFTGLLMLSIFIQLILESLTLISLSLLFLFIYSFSSRSLKEKTSFWKNINTQKMQSYNYIVNLPSKSKEEKKIRKIVLFAHYDSKSLSLHPIFEGMIYFFGLVGGTIFSIHVSIILLLFLLNAIPVIDPIQFFYIFIIIPLYCIEIFNKTGNKSPGANDNACGVASGMYLIEKLKVNPLKNTDIIIVFTGAEEIGNVGASKFLKENYKDLSEDNTYFIIIDGPGGNLKANMCIYGQGLPKKSFSELIEFHSRKVIESNDNLKMEFFYVPPLIPFTSDHTPLKFFGDYQFMIFTSNSRWHSDKDNIENYYFGMLENFFIFLKELLYSIDKKEK